MKKNRFVSAALAGMVFLAGCMPKIVKETSSLYDSGDFKAIEKAIYAERNTPEDDSFLIKNVENFFQCDYKTARQFIDKQKQVYIWYERCQKDERSRDPFSTVESSTQFHNAFYDLEFFMNNSLDKKHAEELSKKFSAIGQKF